MGLGKQRRLSSLYKNNMNTIIVPMDHGMTLGPIKGISRIEETIQLLKESYVDGVILHKGMIYTCAEQLMDHNLSIIMHLSASTYLSPNPESKTIVGSVLEAVAFGCDAVSVQINIGDKNEEKMLGEVGKIASDCYKYGMPLIAMIYARGERVDSEKSLDKIMHAARVGAEIGADLVKVSYNDDPISFKEAVQGCPIPIMIAGGEKNISDFEFLKQIEQAMTTGIRGVSVGRNVFQSNNITVLIQGLHQIVHQERSFEKVVKELKY